MRKFLTYILLALSIGAKDGKYGADGSESTALAK